MVDRGIPDLRVLGTVNPPESQGLKVLERHHDGCGPDGTIGVHRIETGRPAWRPFGRQSPDSQLFQTLQGPETSLDLRAAIRRRAGATAR